MTSPTKKYSKGALETESFEVVVVKDPKLRPFLNTFHSSGNNIQQRRLGKIFGIIQVDDTSEGSAYLPNLLTQIIKKEYFKNKKDNCGRSFEIALRKANIALTELAQHEIVKWMNNLNVAIGVICGNEFHFTQVGKGKVLFLKKNKITEVGQNSEKNQDYHPMKTFSTISAGRVSDGNKLIFTIGRTFENLNKEEIKRHYKTFTSDEFDNIISSTLRNEASNTGMVVINATKEACSDESLVMSEDSEPEFSEAVNFFGQEKEEKKVEKKEIVEEKKKEKPREKPELKDNGKGKSPFEKEPEIYVKETDDTEVEEIIEAKKEASKKLTKIKNFFMALSGKLINSTKDKISLKKIIGLINPIIPRTKSLTKGLMNFSGKSFSKIKKGTGTLRDKSIKKIRKINLPKPKIEKEFFFEKIEILKKLLSPLGNKENYQKIFEKMKALIPEKKKQSPEKKEESLIEEWPLIEEESPAEEEPVVSSFEKKPTNFFEKFDQPEESLIPSKDSGNLMSKINSAWKKIKNFFLKLPEKKHFKKIALSILIATSLIIIGSILINKIKSQSKEIVATNQQKEIQPENKSNIKNLSQLISLNKKIQDSAFLRNNLFFLTEEKSLIKFSVRNNTKTEILLPEELQNPRYLSTIESLQIILIIGPKDVYSYSPVTNSFAKNNITFPGNPESAGVGTYLTYFYLLDKKSNQIYRYHRAPGGFGPSQQWLSENQNFENAVDIDVSDSIYVGFSNGKIEKYFDNKKTAEWMTEENFTPDKIDVEINKEGVLALDKKQGKIIRLSESDGSIEMIQDDFMKDSQDFSVDFDNKEIFIVTKDSNLIKFNYQ